MFKKGLLILLSGLLLSACASGETSSSASTSKDFETVSSALYEAFGEEGEAQDSSTVCKLLNLDEDQIENAVAYYSSVDSSNFLILVESDESYTDEVSGSLSYYLDTLKSSASQYTPEQAERLEEAWSNTYGTYNILVLTNNMGDFKKEAASILG